MSVNPVLLELPDLVGLKEQAESIHLPNNQKVSLSGFGNKKSPFRSRGLDFQEVRVYQPGDDIRQIDWHVTAKYGEPFTKLYTEEKDQQIYLICDLRPNMHFAGQGHFKSVIAGRLTALSAFIANKKKDSLAYALMGEKAHFSTPNVSSENLIPALLDILVQLPCSDSALTFKEVLTQMGHNLKTGASILIFSDFSDITISELEQLGHLGIKNAITLVHIYDELEKQLPKEMLPFSNTKETLFLDGNNFSVQTLFQKSWEEQTNLVRQAVQKYGWGYLSLKTNSDYIKLFTQFCLG
ncbi:MAG: DUF58 domain-containing protein [Alphaproteobacteria bacterium]